MNYSVAERLIELGELNEYDYEYERLLMDLLEFKSFNSLSVICFNQLQQGIEVFLNVRFLERAVALNSEEALFTLLRFYKFADSFPNDEQLKDRQKSDEYLLRVARLRYTNAEIVLFDEFYRGVYHKVT